MEIKKKITFVIIFFASIIFFFNTSSYAGVQKWNALDYDVTVNLDGSMDVVETWNTYISETNTLFKDFEISNEDDYRITNVKVSRVMDNSGEYYLNEINEEQYHVDSGCYYGLQIDYDTFEIAWNVGLDNSSGTRTYKIYYTVENAIKVYNDCAELYWQFLSEENTMTGRNITGTVRLPNGLTNIDELRVWGHGDYNAIINKDSANKVSFSLDTLKSNTMLEVRVVTEKNIFEECTNIYNKNKLSNILEEEQRFADKANRDRELAKAITKALDYAWIVFVIINIILFILLMIKRNKYKNKGKELKEKYPDPLIEIDYFREIPDEKNATPARAVYLHNFKNNVSQLQSDLSNIFSATILDLSLKGAITFRTVDENETTSDGIKAKKNEVRIYRGDKTKYECGLSRDESIVYEIVQDAMIGKEYITIKDFSEYASKHNDDVYLKLNNIEISVKTYQRESKKISNERKKDFNYWNSEYSKYLIISIVLLCMPIFPGLIIGFGMLAYTCRKNSLYFSILSENAQEEKMQWDALLNYMNDYSMLDEKNVADVNLWEKYLVYATAFGISKKVIKQLKVVHPELFNENNFERGSYWFIMTNPTFGANYFMDFSKDLSNVYNSARSAYTTAHSSYSSGSGGGGGFSSGGGGRRRRR